MERLVFLQGYIALSNTQRERKFSSQKQCFITFVFIVSLKIYVFLGNKFWIDDITKSYLTMLLYWKGVIILEKLHQLCEALTSHSSLNKRRVTCVTHLTFKIHSRKRHNWLFPTLFLHFNLQLALANICVCSCKHNSSWVVASMHAQVNSFSSKHTRFDPYFGWILLPIIIAAKVGVKSCRLAGECTSFVHAWM